MTLETIALAFAKLGLNLLHAIIGACGAVISLALFAFPASIQASLLKRITVVIAGACLSGFGTDTTLGLLGMNPSAGGITGWLLGLFGISLMMKIFEAIQKADIANIIKARFGGGNV